MRFFSAIVTFVFIVVLGVALAFHFVMPMLDGPGPLAQAKNIIIVRGTGASAIGRQLEKEGVVKNHMLFRLRYAMAGQPELKAGEYQFAPQVSIADAIGLMASGDVFVRKVTVPEGRTVAEIIDILKKEPSLTGEIGKLPAEGTLAPDTYRFAYGETRQSIVEQMQRDMKAAVDLAWAQRDADTPLKSPEEMVTLASIVEKETGVPAERARVAGVFINRLRKNMLLQSDPTVIYGITEGKGPLGRGLTVSELEKETPYNSYKKAGLPPTPIANPGKASLMATAKPEKHDFIYFVADGTGGHKFSASLNEHNKNVAGWRKVEKEDAKAAKEQKAEEEKGQKAKAASPPAAPAPVTGPTPPAPAPTPPAASPISAPPPPPAMAPPTTPTSSLAPPPAAQPAPAPAVPPAAAAAIDKPPPMPAIAEPSLGEKAPESAPTPATAAPAPATTPAPAPATAPQATPAPVQPAALTPDKPATADKPAAKETEKKPEEPVNNSSGSTIIKY